jgi:hypothetical protein
MKTAGKQAWLILHELLVIMRFLKQKTQTGF